MTHDNNIKHKLYSLKRRFLANLAPIQHWKYRLKVYREKYTDFKQVVKVFEATSNTEDLTGWHSGNSSVLWLDHEKAEEILGKIGWYSFRYLFRRFGYPMYGYDSRKDLIQYIVNTPLPEVKLVIYVNGYSARFGRSISPELHKTIENEQKLFHRRLVKYTYEHLVLEALYTTIADLLKPVGIRDVYLNINGECEPECNEDEEPIVASSSLTTGLGLGDVAIALREYPKRWWRLTDLIYQLGGNNFKVGVERTIELLGGNTNE